jgi:hypothetical protein
VAIAAIGRPTKSPSSPPNLGFEQRRVLYRAQRRLDRLAGARMPTGELRQRHTGACTIAVETDRAMKAAVATHQPVAAAGRDTRAAAVEDRRQLTQQLIGARAPVAAR